MISLAVHSQFDSTSLQKDEFAISSSIDLTINTLVKIILFSINATLTTVKAATNIQLS